MKARQIEKMIDKLKNFRNTEALVSFSSAGLIAFSSIIILLTLAVWIELYANGGVDFRTGLFCGLIVFGIVAFSFSIFAPLKRFVFVKQEALDQVAKRIGKQIPEIDDSVSNAIQLYWMQGDSSDPETLTIGRKQIFSKELILAGIGQNISPYLDYDFNALIDKSKLRISLILLLISSVLYLGSYLGSGNSFPDAQERLFNYSTVYIPDPVFTVEIGDLPDKIKSGETAKINIFFGGVAPERAYIYHRNGDDQFNKSELIIDKDGFASHITLPLKEDYSFYIAVPWYGTEIETEINTIDVENVPYVMEFSGRIVFPSYTGISPVMFDNNSPEILGLKGSKVHFNVVANTDLSSAEISIIEGDSEQGSESLSSTIQLETDGKRALGSMTLNANGSYRIKLISNDGLEDRNEGSYAIRVYEDAYPSIRTFQEEKEINVDESGIIQLEGLITDDFGFHKLFLYYRLSKSQYTEADKNYKKLEVFIDKDVTTQEYIYLWDMNSIGISPSDEYEYYLEVADNDYLAGYKKAKTDIYKAKLLSLEELLSSADKKQDEIKQKLKEAVKEAEQIKEKLDDLKQDLRSDFNKKEMTFEQKKKASELANKQKELNQKIEDIQKDLAETTKDLQKNNLLSKETLEEYMELQKLMEKIKDPELEKMSEKIKDELNKLSPDEMRKMLEKSELDEEQFRQSIKRTMERLKKIDMARKADALQKMADKLSEEQKELAEQNEKSGEMSEEEKKKAEDKQNALSKKLDDLQKKAQELKEQMSDASPETKEMMEKAEAALDKENTQKMMQQASQQMQQNQNQQASKNQKQAAQNLENFASQMQQMNQRMSQQQKEQMLKDMQKQMQDILDISKKQEALKQQTQNSNSQSSKLPQINKEQGQLKESLRNLSKQMQQLSEQSSALSPEMGKKLGEAMKEMGQANDQLSERRPSQASQNQQGAMAALNSLAGQMQAAMGQMQGGQGSGQGSPGGSNPMGQNGQGQGQGMGQGQLQQAAAQQQMLMDAMRKMQQGQGPGGNTPGTMNDKQKAEYSRLQNGQGDAKKTIDQMIEEEKRSQSPNGQKIKELQDIAKDMQEVISDINNGRVDDETMKKQEKILTRMLDAVKSKSERDFSKKREGKSGRDYMQELSKEELEKLRRKALQEMINRDQRKYRKDYERIIREYYEGVEQR